MFLLCDHHLGGLLSEAHGGRSGLRALAVALWGWGSLPKLWGMASQYGVPRWSWGLCPPQTSPGMCPAGTVPNPDVLWLPFLELSLTAWCGILLPSLFILEACRHLLCYTV